MTTPKDILLLKKLWEQSLVSHNLLDAPLKTFCKEIIEGKQVSLGEVLVRLGVISPKELQTLEQDNQQLLREIAPQKFASTPLGRTSVQTSRDRTNGLALPPLLVSIQFSLRGGRDVLA